MWIFIFLVRSQGQSILVIKLSGFAEMFTFSTPAPMVSVLAGIAHYATSSLIWRKVGTCMTSFSAKNQPGLKLYIIKRKFNFYAPKGTLGGI